MGILNRNIDVCVSLRTRDELASLVSFIALTAIFFFQKINTQTEYKNINTQTEYNRCTGFHFPVRMVFPSFKLLLSANQVQTSENC